MQTNESLTLFKQELKDTETNNPQSIVSNFKLEQDSKLALLNQLFPEQKYEDKSVKQARAILGDLTRKFSAEELQQIMVLLQYLTESWLDRYERDLFNGKTLNELLNNG